MKRAVVLWGFFLFGAATVFAETSPSDILTSARQAFATGSWGSAELVEQLTTARDQLLASGDADQAAQASLLLLAAQGPRADLEPGAQATWDLQKSREQNAQAWTMTKAVSWSIFATSCLSTIVLATLIDTDEESLASFTDTEYDSRKATVTKLTWALGFSAGTAFLSLFPLLWAEVRQ